MNKGGGGVRVPVPLLKTFASVPLAHTPNNNVPC